MSKFVHMELSTSDPEAAQKFYKSVFGWKYQKMKMADGTVYVGFTGDGEGIGGGIMKSPDPNMPPAWLGYVGVGSVKRAIAKVEKNGGKVIAPRMEIANIGALAVFSDPQGAVFAVWEPFARPADATAEPAAAQQAPEAAPKAKKTAKKAAGKKAAKKEAAAEPAPAAKKKATKKKAASKKA